MVSSLHIELKDKSDNAPFLLAVSSGIDSMVMLEYFKNYANNNEITFWAPENWNGVETITIGVNDGELSATEDIIATVIPVNDPPVSSDISVTTYMNIPINPVIAH